jgi:hypothetical protein
MLLAPLYAAQTVSEWNPLDKHANITLSNGDRDATAGATNRGVRGERVRSAGVRYFEVIIFDGTDMTVGLATSGTSLTSTSTPSVGVGVIVVAGSIFKDGALDNSGSAYAVTDIVGVKWDATAGSIQFYKNGSTNGTAVTYAAGTSFYPWWQTTNAGTSGRGRICTSSSQITNLPGGALPWG